MYSKPDINNELNYPELTDGKNVELFHCHKCGYHPQVLVTGYHKQNSDAVYSRVLLLYPQWTNIVESILHAPYSTDIEIIECITCLKCGGNGEMVSIPKIILQSCG